MERNEFGWWSGEPACCFHLCFLFTLSFSQLSFVLGNMISIIKPYFLIKLKWNTGTSTEGNTKPAIKSFRVDHIIVGLAHFAPCFIIQNLWRKTWDCHICFCTCKLVTKHVKPMRIVPTKTPMQPCCRAKRSARGWGRCRSIPLAAHTPTLHGLPCWEASPELALIWSR